MKGKSRRDRLPPRVVNFELLRAKVEAQVARPAVIAITSSTTDDGKEIIARGLADSLASSGYTTLFFDACPDDRALTKPQMRISLEEAGRQLIIDPASERVTTLNLGDLSLEKTTSQRQLQSTLEVLCSKFDYVLVNTEYSDSKALSATIIGAADAVLVSVRTGRRETVEDAKLADDLDSIGPRFLGVVAVDPSVIDSWADSAQGDALPDWRPRQNLGAQEKSRREMIEWPT